mgnify:CR=1 FL=1
MILTDDNFDLYGAKFYDNPQYFDNDEFKEDIKRFSYIKKAFIRYSEGFDIKERLLLNQIIIIYNLFGSAATEMLFFKTIGYHSYLKPFIVLLKRLPEKVSGIYTSDVTMDVNIVERLRKL